MRIIDSKISLARNIDKLMGRASIALEAILCWVRCHVRYEMSLHKCQSDDRRCRALRNSAVDIWR